jgi:hypothetical protein
MLCNSYLQTKVTDGGFEDDRGLHSRQNVSTESFLKVRDITSPAHDTSAGAVNLSYMIVLNRLYDPTGSKI